MAGWWPLTVHKDWCGEWEDKQGSILIGEVGSELILGSGLGVRARKGVCYAAGYKKYGIWDKFDQMATVADLVKLSADELLQSKGFGMTALVEVRNFLRERGLRLKGE